MDKSQSDYAEKLDFQHMHYIQNSTLDEKYCLPLSVSKGSLPAIKPAATAANANCAP